MVDLEAVVKTV